MMTVDASNSRKAKQTPGPKHVILLDNNGGFHNGGFGGAAEDFASQGIPRVQQPLGSHTYHGRSKVVRPSLNNQLDPASGYSVDPSKSPVSAIAPIHHPKTGSGNGTQIGVNPSRRPLGSTDQLLSAYTSHSNEWTSDVSEETVMLCVYDNCGMVVAKENCGGGCAGCL